MLIDPEVRQSILMSAYTRIVEGTEVAVKALVDIAEGGRSEIARVQAAKEILDRAGLSPELRIAIRGEDSSDDRIYRLKQQLDQTRERLMESSIETTAAPEPESKEPDSSFETPELPFETEDASEPVEVLKGELVDYEPLTIDNMPPGLR